MHRSIQLPLLMLVLIAVVFTGCDRDANIAEQQLATGVAEPVRRSGNSYRAGLTREALKGLKYDSGRVTIDTAVAAQVVRGLAIVDAPEMHAAGIVALEHGDLLTALKSTTQAIILDSNRAELYETLGSTLLCKKKAKMAEAAFRTAIELDPEFGLAHEKLALTLSGSASRFEEAIQHYGIAADLDPENGYLYSRMAILNFYLQRPDQSRDYIKLASANGYQVPPQLLGLMNGSIGAIQSKQLRLMPTVGAQVRVDINNTDSGVETSAAANDLEPNFVIAGWNDYRTTGIRSGFAISDDGGSTWNDTIVRPPLANRSNTEGDPMTAFDNRTGNMWVGAISFGANGGVYVARKNAGDNFFQPTVMAEEAPLADKPWMAAGVDPVDPELTRVYIGYNQGLLISADDGDTWTGPLPFPEAGLGWLPRVGPDGELYLVYWDISDGVKMLRSFDGGTTLEGPIDIATRLDVWGADGSRFPGRFRAPPLNAFAVDPNDGTLYVVWFDTTSVVDGNSNVDLYLSQSIDQGDTWTSPTIINSDADTPGDQFFPWIEVDRSGRLHLVFYDSRSVVQDDNPTDTNAEPSAILETFYSFSDDGGSTWSEIVLTPAPFDTGLDGFGGTFIGDYVGMAVSGTTVYPCYPSTQNGIAEIFVQEVVCEFQLGDVNEDGVIDLLDVQPFVSLILNGEFNKAADINTDGTVDMDDIDGFVTLLIGA